MSTFTTEQLKKKWADYEDSESEREDEFNAPNSKPNGHKKRGKELVQPRKDDKEEDDDDDEEEEEEEEEDEEEEQLDLSRIKIATNQSKVEKKNRNLSKKEQLELKKKELEELESLLAEYRVETDPSPEAQQKSEDVQLSEKLDGNSEEAKGKKKKKKKASNKVESVVDVTEASTTVITEPVDVTNILKSKIPKKSSSSSKKSTPDPLKIAMEEAMKSSSSKKKKRDKSKFNEASY